MQVTRIGLDIAKNVFQVHGADAHGKVVLRKQLSRGKVLSYFAQLPSCLVGLETCGGAHYWARELQKLGHDARLMAAAMIAPYRTGQKNDANDAEAICEAVSRPRTRFVPVKSEAQQAVLTVHREQVKAIRMATAELKEEQRLLARVVHLRELVGWGEQWQPRLREAAESQQPMVSEKQAAAFGEALGLAHKVLNDHEPQATDRLLALAEREARTGRHGDFYDGYLRDVSLDADSELICALDVLPANGDEGANAKARILDEEQAQGNDIGSRSSDRIGYRGDVLAELSDDVEGPQLTGYVPPIDWTPPAAALFQATAFTLKEAGTEGRGPGGATTRTRMRAKRGYGGPFHFRATQCHPCPLRAQCLRPTTRGGRTVIKNDYEAQYRAAQQRAQTKAYRAVRREHPRLERKLAEMIRWHAGRCVRYRGRPRVKVQYLLTAVGVNCKRIVKLLSLPCPPPPASSVPPIL